MAEKTNTLSFHHRLWSLKECAREIRRRWPGTDFERRPIFQTSWQPDPMQRADWLTSAQFWHKSFFSLQQFQQLADAHAPYLHSLDFDGVMELIDRVEQQHLQQESREIFCGPRAAPIVVANSYGRKANSEPQWGFFLQNHGEPAFGIAMMPLEIGGCLLETPTHVVNLSRESSTAFLEVLIRDNDRTIRSGSAALWRLLRDNKKPNANGRLLPIDIRLIYSSTVGKTYITRHGIEADPDVEERIIISNINTEEIVARTGGCSG